MQSIKLFKAETDIELYDNRTMYRYPEKFTLLSKNILMPNRKEFCSFRRMLRRENNDETKGL